MLIHFKQRDYCTVLFIYQIQGSYERNKHVSLIILFRLDLKFYINCNCGKNIFFNLLVFSYIDCSIFYEFLKIDDIVSVKYVSKLCTFYKRHVQNTMQFSVRLQKGHYLTQLQFSSNLLVQHSDLYLLELQVKYTISQ